MGPATKEPLISGSQDSIQKRRIEIAFIFSGMPDFVNYNQTFEK